MINLIDVVSNFVINGDVVSVEPYGNGHINDTYCVNATDKGKTVRYILQRLNTNVFPRTKELMENVHKVTSFLAEKIKMSGGDPLRETLTLIPTNDGGYYFNKNDDFFRMYVFIEGAIGYQIADDADMFASCGKAFGNFINMLNDFPAKELHEVIFNFHNTLKRFETFCESLDKDYNNRSETCKKEIDFILSRKDYCSMIVEKLASGDLPLRVTHNDTKLNNVLIDPNTKIPVCVIDLDTIMPGSLLYDFGDAIRSGCNTGLEDEKDLSKVNFDINLFEKFVSGFMSGIGECITANEVEMLPYGAILMTFECGIRFLADYLIGDKYFKIHYDEHNLVRARTQYKMVADMEAVLPKMKEIVRKYSKL